MWKRHPERHDGNEARAGASVPAGSSPLGRYHSYGQQGSDTTDNWLRS